MIPEMSMFDGEFAPRFNVEKALDAILEPPCVNPCSEQPLGPVKPGSSVEKALDAILKPVGCHVSEEESINRMLCTGENPPEPHFEVGDVVELKSGGPSMTISRINEDESFCIWFESREQSQPGRVRSNKFPLSCLRGHDPMPCEPETRPENQTVTLTTDLKNT